MLVSVNRNYYFLLFRTNLSLQPSANMYFIMSSSLDNKMHYCEKIVGGTDFIDLEFRFVLIDPWP